MIHLLRPERTEQGSHGLRPLTPVEVDVAEHPPGKPVLRPGLDGLPRLLQLPLHQVRVHHREVEKRPAPAPISRPTEVGERPVGIPEVEPPEAGERYWRDAGLEVVDSVRIETGSGDTRSVYGVRGAQVTDAAARLAAEGADAILLSGTGMPTLRAIVAIERATGRPVLSSNLCLAWAVLHELGLPEAPEACGAAGTGETILRGWPGRLPPA